LSRLDIQGFGPLAGRDVAPIDGIVMRITVRGQGIPVRSHSLKQWPQTAKPDMSMIIKSILTATVAAAATVVGLLHGYDGIVARTRRAFDEGSRKSHAK